MLRISEIVAVAPSARPLLSLAARYLLASESPADLKSADDFAARLAQLVNALYKGTIGNDFIDAMGALIARQLTLAYREAWKDEGMDGDVPDYLTSAAEDAIVAQYDFVDGFYKDIIDAREDKRPVDGLLSRVPAWANRYNENYNNGVHLITLENGGRETYQLGMTERHCWICRALNGITLFAKEWESLGVRPQNAPNPILSLTSPSGEKGCGGWQCDCGLNATDKRRTPKGYETVMNIVTR